MTILSVDVLERIVHFAAFGCFDAGTFAGLLGPDEDDFLYPQGGNHEALWQLARTSSVFRRLALPVLWQTVEISTFRQFARFVSLAAICPAGVAHVRNFFLSFKPVRPFDGTIDLDEGQHETYWLDYPEEFVDWVFKDRRPRHVENNNDPRGRMHRALLRHDLDDGDVFERARWGIGPDSERSQKKGLLNALTLMPDARTTQAEFEQLVQQMERLQRFCVHTRWLPLSQRLCQSLAEKTTLRVLMIGRQGEHELDAPAHTPLEDIFADDGRGRPLRGSNDGRVIYVARLHLLRPKDCARAGEDRAELLFHEGATAAFDRDFDGHAFESFSRAKTHIPESYQDHLYPDELFAKSGYVRPDMITFSRLSTYLSDMTDYPSFFDLAAWHSIQALDVGASRIKLLVVGHCSRCIVRIPQALFLWVKVKVSMLRITEKAMMDTWEAEPYFRAARALRLACRQTASQLAGTRGHKLEPEDIQHLPEFESALSVYGSWLSDASVQEPIARAWNEQVDLGQTDDFDEGDLVDTITRGQSLLQLELAEEFLRHSTAAADALCVREALRIGEDCEGWEYEEYDDDEVWNVPYPIYDDYDEYDDHDGSDSWTDDDLAEDDGESGSDSGSGADP